METTLLGEKQQYIYWQNTVIWQSLIVIKTAT